MGGRVIRHCLLGKVQSFGQIEALDGDDLLSMHIPKGSEAGSEILKAYFPVYFFGKQHGAGTAITLPATDFCAGQVFMVADKIQQRRSGGERSCNFFLIE